MAEFTLTQQGDNLYDAINRILLRDSGAARYGTQIVWTDYDGNVRDRRTGAITGTGEPTLTIENGAGEHILVRKSTDSSTVFEVQDTGVTAVRLNPAGGALSVGGALTVDGAFVASGNAQMGNAEGETVTVTDWVLVVASNDLIFKDDAGAEIVRFGDTSSVYHLVVTGPAHITGALLVGGILTAAGYTARAYRSTNQTIGDSSVTTLTFDSERWDTGALHDTGSNTDRLVAPVAGKYLITAHIQWASNATGERQIRIVDSSANVMAAASQPPVSGNVTRMSIATVVDLTAADYVTVAVFQSSGGNLDVTNASRNSPEATITKVG